MSSCAAMPIFVASMLLCFGAVAAFSLVPAVPARQGRSLMPLHARLDVGGEVDDDIGQVPIKGRKRRALKKALLKVFDSVLDDEDEDAFDQIDIDGDGILSGEEKGLAAFDRIDVDGDGILTKDEISRAGLQLGALGALDTNKDGSIGRDEFEQAIKALGDRLDSAKDGSTSSPSSDQSVVDEIEDTLGELEPLERQELRLGGFEPYILVSVLTAEASFSLISDTSVDNWDKILHPTSFLDFLSADWCQAAVLLVSGGSTIAGIYATVIFSLTVLYGKTALGLDRDDDYYSFMDGTGLQRFRAFQAFTYGLFLFSVSVCLELCLKCPGLLRIPCVAVSAAGLYFGKKEYDAIMAAAAPMFAPKKSKEDNVAETVEDDEVNGGSDCYLDEFDGEECKLDD